MKYRSKKPNADPRKAGDHQTNLVRPRPNGESPLEGSLEGSFMPSFVHVRTGEAVSSAIVAQPIQTAGFDGDVRWVSTSCRKLTQ